MIKPASKKIYPFLLWMSLCIMNAKFADAQQLPTTQSTGSAQTHLNKMFSSNSNFGPLNSTHSLASSDELMLFWSEPPSTAQPGDGTPDSYHFQIMSYL